MKPKLTCNPAVATCRPIETRLDDPVLDEAVRVIAEAARAEDEPKHTPGPWIAREKFGIPGDVTTTYNGHCGEPLDVATARGVFYDERRANARLIAAAPELLAALNNAVSALMEYVPKASRGHAEGCFKYVAGGFDMWNCKCPICIARAAIAKARGESEET